MYITEYRTSDGVSSTTQSTQYSKPDKVLGDLISVMKTSRNALGELIWWYDSYVITEIRQYYDYELEKYYKIKARIVAWE